MRKLFILILAGGFGGLCAFGATGAKESRITQVVNDVQIISTSDNSSRAAAIDGVFAMQEVLRTGAAARAELVGEDHSVTRVGANTVFSFGSADRGLQLEQGSLLLSSPKGGSGSVQTPTATIFAPGATMIVTTAANGESKILVLEGTAEVHSKGGHQRLRAGELMLVLPGGLPGQISNFRLDELVAKSKLVSGFAQPLTSLTRIDSQISRQLRDIQSGRAEEVKNVVPVVNPIEEINGRLAPRAGLNLPVPGRPFPGELPPQLPQPQRGPQVPINSFPILPPPPIQGGSITINPITINPITVAPPPVPITALPITILPPPVQIVTPPITVLPPPILIVAPPITVVTPAPVVPTSPIGVVIVGVSGGTLAPNPNIGAAVVPGNVNFIQNVNYQGQPAQHLVGGTGFTIGHP